MAGIVSDGAQRGAASPRSFPGFDGDERVGTVGEGGVGPGAAVELVGAALAFEVVVAGFAVELVVARTAEEAVVPDAAEEGVIAGEAKQDAAESAGADEVISASADHFFDVAPD